MVVCNIKVFSRIWILIRYKHALVELYNSENSYVDVPFLKVREKDLRLIYANSAWKRMGGVMI